MRTFAIVTALMAAGCGRNELSGNVDFPEVDDHSVDPPLAMGQWMSLDRSPDGTQLTMSYYDGSRTALGFAVGTPLGDGTVRWAHERVDAYPESNGLDTGARGKYTSQKTAPDGTVWISYWDEDWGKLRVAHRLAPATWEAVDVDTGGGLWTSLAIGDNGQPFIVHCTDDGSVRLSRYDGSTWSTSTIFTSSATAYQEASVVTTAALVSGGHEYVAFADRASGALHLMTDGVDDLVVGSGGGEWPSIAVDGTTVYVAFYDATREDLVVAEKGQGDETWKRTSVDEGKLRGADTAIYVDGGEPVVVYFDGFENDQRIARRAGNAWSTDRLAGDGLAAGFHNEVVFVADHWWAGSFDYTNQTATITQL
ncbi:MAG: hypothetical protein KC621_30700 [Myxococcales bacterium]|nr:hypothetical protein [Myxococcales bacterium]